MRPELRSELDPILDTVVEQERHLIESYVLQVAYDKIEENPRVCGAIVEYAYTRFIMEEVDRACCRRIENDFFKERQEQKAREAKQARSQSRGRRGSRDRDERGERRGERDRVVERRG
jgi:hypothetical protein